MAREKETICRWNNRKLKFFLLVSVCVDGSPGGAKASRLETNIRSIQTKKRQNNINSKVIDNNNNQIIDGEWWLGLFQSIGFITAQE